MAAFYAQTLATTGSAMSGIGDMWGSTPLGTTGASIVSSNNPKHTQQSNFVTQTHELWPHRDGSEKRLQVRDLLFRSSNPGMTDNSTNQGLPVSNLTQVNLNLRNLYKKAVDGIPSIRSNHRELYDIVTSWDDEALYIERNYRRLIDLTVDKDLVCYRFLYSRYILESITFVGSVRSREDPVPPGVATTPGLQTLEERNGKKIAVCSHGEVKIFPYFGSGVDVSDVLLLVLRRDGDPISISNTRQFGVRQPTMIHNVIANLCPFAFVPRTCPEGSNPKLRDLKYLSHTGNWQTARYLVVGKVVDNGACIPTTAPACDAMAGMMPDFTPLDNGYANPEAGTKISIGRSPLSYLTFF